MEPLPERLPERLPEDEPSAPRATAAAASFDLAYLQSTSMAELLRAAHDANLAGGDTDLSDRPALILALLEHGCAPAAVGRGCGVLEVHPEGFGFLRSRRHSCRPGADDIYLSQNQIHRLRLASGQEIEGEIRLPRPSEGYLAMTRIDRVDGARLDDILTGREARVPFRYLTPVVPNARLPLAHPGGPSMLRVLDLLAPVGLGHRVVVRAPTAPARRRTLRAIGEGILHGREGARVLALLLDQEPDAADWSDDPRLEFYSSTFDEAPERHVQLFRLAMARAERLVESGAEVALLLDSLTGLTRACNATVPHSGKIISAGLDAKALIPPKELLCAARQTEEGGSLTVFATLVAEGELNSVIADEFAGRANVEIELIDTAATGELQVDARRTRTRNEDITLPHDERRGLGRLRATLHGMPPDAADRHLRELVAAGADPTALLRKLAARP